MFHICITAIKTEQNTRTKLRNKRTVRCFSRETCHLFSSVLLFKILIAWKRINCTFHGSDFFLLFLILSVYVGLCVMQDKFCMWNNFPFTVLQVFPAHKWHWLDKLWNSKFWSHLLTNKRNWHFSWQFFLRIKEKYLQ